MYQGLGDAHSALWVLFPRLYLGKNRLACLELQDAVALHARLEVGASGNLGHHSDLRSGGLKTGTSASSFLVRRLDGLS